MKEIVNHDMGNEINGGDDDRNSTQVDASRNSQEGQGQSLMKA